jgi:hypothetical protein
VALSIKTVLPAAGGRWKLDAETVLKLATRDAGGLLSNGGIDFGAQVLATRYFSSSCVHASVSFTTPLRRSLARRLKRLLPPCSLTSRR